MNLCFHLETTEADKDGLVICLKCGVSIQQVLTRELLDETIERVYRQGYHSMKCVRSDLGWICAEDCPTRRSP